MADSLESMINNKTYRFEVNEKLIKLKNDYTTDAFISEFTRYNADKATYFVETMVEEAPFLFYEVIQSKNPTKEQYKALSDLCHQKAQIIADKCIIEPDREAFLNGIDSIPDGEVSRFAKEIGRFELLSKFFELDSK